jgi:hypothetical protein
MVDPISLTAGAGAAAGGTASTLGTLGTVGSGIGAVVSGIGSLFSGKANSQAYAYKAGVALLNKQINQQNANWALEEGDIKGEETGLRAGQEIARTKVMQAASGIDVNSGTSSAVRDTQTKVAQFDQNVISWDASKTAWGFESKAATDQAEANLDTMASSNATTAGEISAAGSFISGAGSVASKWYQGQSIGLGSNRGSTGSSPFDITGSFY